MGITRYSFNCAQMAKRQSKVQKTAGPGIKHCGKGRMDAFDCDGWLYIWASPGSNTVFVRIRHKEQHVHYCCIDVSDNV